MLQVYLKSSDVYYIGKFCYREEKGLDSWLVLIDYISINKKTNEEIYNPEEANLKSTVMINLRDIERVEFIYDDNSKTWKKIKG